MNPVDGIRRGETPRRRMSLRHIQLGHGNRELPAQRKRGGACEGDERESRELHSYYARALSVTIPPRGVARTKKVVGHSRE